MLVKKIAYTTISFKFNQTGLLNNSQHCRKAALQHTKTTIAVLLGYNPNQFFIPVLGPTSHWRASGLLA